MEAYSPEIFCKHLKIQDLCGARSSDISLHKPTLGKFTSYRAATASVRSSLGERRVFGVLRGRRPARAQSRRLGHLLTPYFIPQNGWSS